MNLQARKEALSLLVGDLLVLVFALWSALFFRYLTLPDYSLLYSHLKDFAPIIGLWVLVFFISDFYGKQRGVLRKRLPQTIIRAQIANGLIATVLFYFLPIFNIAPKLNLFIYLGIATLFLLGWRIHLWPVVYRSRRETVVFLGNEPELLEVKQELATNPKYNIDVVEAESLPEAKKLKPAAVVVNIYDQNLQALLPDFYHLFASGTRFLSLHRLYEELFGQIPVSVISERWFLEYISNRRRITYDLLKRLMDLAASIIFAVITLPFYPLVWLAIKLDDGGPVFYVDERVGRGGRPLLIYKFRSMSLEPNLADRKVTRAGKWLRNTRIDELPQLWSVVRGHQSLVGPRPEKPDYAALYREKIPYYDARHFVAPGLSGWAQIYHEAHPHFRPMIEDTRDKLSYDLYYVKNRGIWLDFEIALKTIKTLLSRTGI